MFKSEGRRFLYQAGALAAGGTFTKPYNEFMESQASSVLPIDGGMGRARVEKFAHRNIVAFDAAETQVLGQPGTAPDTHACLATATIEGLNTLNMVTASRVSARLAWHSFDDGQETQFQAVGSYIENLRVAGQPVDVKLDEEVLSGWDTYAKAREGMIKRTGMEIQWGKAVGASIVASISRIAGATVDGNRIDVPEFGSIHLGEIYISLATRRLVMMRIRYGCPVDGSAGYGDVEGNGYPFP